MNGLNFWWKKYQHIKLLINDVKNKGETVEECIERLVKENK